MFAWQVFYVLNIDKIVKFILKFTNFIPILIPIGLTYCCLFYVPLFDNWYPSV